MPYNVSYENLSYPDFDGFLPDSQPLCEGLDISTAFAILAELEARAFLDNGAFGYTATDQSYAIAPNLED